MASKNCHKCHTEWIPGEMVEPAIKETCVKCNAYLHCCKNCKFHRPSMHNQCYIPNTEWVGDRTGANFCEEFEFAVTEPAAGQAISPKEEAKAALDALFGKGPAAGPPKAHPGFDDLFKG